MSSLRQLGRYRIEAYKGKRGDAEAYRAFDMIRKRTVLLLTLKPETVANQQKLGQILDTAQAVSELVHPRIGWVWETGTEDATTYVAERLVNGPSLRERLDEARTLTWEEASQISDQLAQGLDFLHSHGRVHGALRPENIMLGAEVGVVLSGLGIPEAPLTLADLETNAENRANAQHLDDSPLSVGVFNLPGEKESNRLPEHLAAAPYTAPEVWMGEAPTAASDQYALACVLVEMLSGKPLFSGKDAAEICERSLEGPLLPARWPEGTPWQIEPALERALSQQPAERFTSTGDFTAAPSRLAARGGSEDERRRREDQRQARLEAEAQARRQAEEAERLAALENARREVEEQARLDAEAQAAVAAIPAAAIPAAAAPAVSIPAAAATESAEHEPHRRMPLETTEHIAAPAGTTQPQKAARRPRWPAWAGIVLLLGLAWLWGSGRLSGGVVPTPSATPGPAATQPVVLPPANTATAAPSATPTHTPEPSATNTLRPSSTVTRRPTLTSTTAATATATLTPTRPPTITRTPRRDLDPDR